MRNKLRNLLFALVAAGPAWCSMSVATIPIDGALVALPGSTVGWGFTFVTDDSNYYVLTGVEYCLGGAPFGTGTCNVTSVGTFTDFASAVNGLIIGPGYSSSPYSEIFDNLLQTGLGSYTVAPSASPQQLLGTFFIHTDIYDGDPAGGGVQVFSDYILVAGATLTVGEGSAVPEPGSLLLVSVAAAALLLMRAR